MFPGVWKSFRCVITVYRYSKRICPWSRYNVSMLISLIVIFNHRLFASFVKILKLFTNEIFGFSEVFFFVLTLFLFASSTLNFNFHHFANVNSAPDYVWTVRFLPLLENFNPIFEGFKWTLPVSVFLKAIKNQQLSIVFWKSNLICILR